MQRQFAEATGAHVLEVGLGPSGLTRSRSRNASLGLVAVDAQTAHVTDSRPTAHLLADALLGSQSAHAVVFCRRALSDSDVDALLAWHSAADARRSLTLVKSPLGAIRDLLFRLLLGCAGWVVYPVAVTDPELRLRLRCPATRVRIGTRARRASWELTALVNGSLHHV